MEREMKEGNLEEILRKFAPSEEEISKTLEYAKQLRALKPVKAVLSR